MNLPGRPDLLLEGDGDLVLRPHELTIRLAFPTFRCGVGDRDIHVVATLRIDVDKPAHILDLFDVAVGLQTESLKQERGLQPGPIKLGHVHARLEMTNVDLLHHGPIPCIGVQRPGARAAAALAALLQDLPLFGSKSLNDWNFKRPLTSWFGADPCFSIYTIPQRLHSASRAGRGVSRMPVPHPGRPGPPRSGPPARSGVPKPLSVSLARCNRQHYRRESRIPQRAPSGAFCALRPGQSSGH